METTPRVPNKAANDKDLLVGFLKNKKISGNVV